MVSYGHSVYLSVILLIALHGASVTANINWAHNKIHGKLPNVLSGPIICPLTILMVSYVLSAASDWCNRLYWESHAGPT
jgi:hypothetical protein